MADYGKDLAYIHDAGFLQLAEEAGPLVVSLLADRGLERGHIVELGSGSGATAQALTEAGHRVLGIDASRAMGELARAQAPDAFRALLRHEREGRRVGQAARVGLRLELRGVLLVVGVTEITECTRIAFHALNQHVVILARGIVRATRVFLAHYRFSKVVERARRGTWPVKLHLLIREV